MKRRLFHLSLLASLTVVVLASSVLGAVLPYFAPGVANAAPNTTYVLYFPEDDHTKGALLAAAKDGGIGKDDTGGVLSQTIIYTTGGRLGTTPLQFNPDFSDKNDIPTYSADYYCYPTKNFSLSTSGPDSNLPYVRFTMGVTLMDHRDWKGLATDKDYKTAVGLLGNSNVGTAHFPEQTVTSGAGNVPAADFDIPGGGKGEHDVRDNVDMKLYRINNDQNVESYNFRDWGVPLDNVDVFKRCMPNPRGNIGNQTININHPDNADQKKEWDNAISQAGLGASVAQAAASTGGISGSDEVPALSCKAGLNPLNWAVCGIVSGLVAIIGQVDNLINSQMTVGSEGTSDNPNQIFCDTSSSGDARKSCEAYHASWSSFRDIALGLLVIIGLVVLISQAIGAEILDAYTVRKVLPRLLIAAIAITLSWQLMQFFVTLTNDLGLGIRHLIYYPFRNFTNSVDLGAGSASGWAVTLATGYAMTAMGIFGLLSFVATAALAVFIGFVILVIRELLIIVLVVIAPIAILLYILPNTQKYYKIWWESFSKALLMFPLIAALIATGRVFAAVASQDSAENPVNAMVAYAAYFGPYFALPLTFQFAGGAMRQIGGFVNDRTKGGFDRLRNFRGNTQKQRWQDLKDGNLLKGEQLPIYGAYAKRFNEASRGAVNLKNAGYNPRRMPERMSMAASTHSTNAAMEALEKNHDITAIKTDDDLVETALRFEKDADVYKHLIARGLTEDRAKQGTAAIRAARRSVSGEVFDKAMLIASAGTSSGWDPQFDEDGNVIDGTGAGGLREMINQKMGKDRQGAIQVLGAVRQMAESKGRFDLVGGSFTQDAQMLENQYNLGTNGMQSSEWTEKIHRNALDGQSRAKLLNGHQRSLNALARVMTQELNEGVTGRGSDGELLRDDNGQDIVWQPEQAVEKYAFMAGALDYASGSAPEMARHIRNQLGQTVDVHSMRPELQEMLQHAGVNLVGPDNFARNDLTHQEIMEALRSNPEFMRYRREYSRGEWGADAQLHQPPTGP